jgi:N-dimethylarginine dimethylaminohydrolase
MAKLADNAESLHSRLLVHRILEASPEPPFEDANEQVRVWGRRWGVENDVGHLRLVLVSRPGDEWMQMSEGGVWVEEAGSWMDPDGRWYWMGKDRPDIEKVQQEHHSLVESLRQEGAEVVFLDKSPPHLSRAVYTRDVAMALPGGSIICRMGPLYRRGEERGMARKLAELGVPILHTIRGSGLVEGGSFAILNRMTAVLGLSHRINTEGARQVKQVLEGLGMELITVELPGSMYHLDGVFVMVDHDKALINFDWLSRPFVDNLKEIGIQTIDVHPSEGPFAVNCIATRPGRVIMSEHAVRTAETLSKCGIEPILISYGEIQKAGGGIHCSTLPLIRDPC